MKLAARTAALILSLLLLASVFGCAKPDTPAEDTTAAAQTDAPAPETEEKDLIDPKLPCSQLGGRGISRRLQRQRP
ncbi:MAG: hypothetical protein J5919_02235 [Clostridia bacterium]|nr:hypothetical protein [Clostridia bacterium]